MKPGLFLLSVGFGKRFVGAKLLLFLINTLYPPIFLRFMRVFAMLTSIYAPFEPKIRPEQKSSPSYEEVKTAISWVKDETKISIVEKAYSILGI